MRELKIIAEPHPPPAWRETVVRGVDQHNVAVTGLSDYYPVGFFVHGNGGVTVGGLLGGIWGGWMMVRSLWVAPSMRGQKIATALMARAHDYAREKSCTHAHLRTGSYEARPFYEKLGYRVYAELKNHPVVPHCRYFLSVKLTEAGRTPHNGRPEILMDPYPSSEKEAVIRIGISWHAYAAMGLPEPRWTEHNFFLRHSEGEVLGGALGNLWGDWLYLDYVWIDRALRGQGHATRLIQAAERSAIAAGCRSAFLDTFSFQARPLYEKLGYHVFAAQEDYPQGHTLYLMTKSLGAS